MLAVDYGLAACTGRTDNDAGVREGQIAPLEVVLFEGEGGRYPVNLVWGLVYTPVVEEGSGETRDEVAIDLGLVLLNDAKGRAYAAVGFSLPMHLYGVGVFARAGVTVLPVGNGGLDLFVSTHGWTGVGDGFALAGRAAAGAGLCVSF
ncbi:MAG: hypothetical protein ACYTFI_02360 [Planctomycetota bacterium]